jgi:hypothetical protein
VVHPATNAIEAGQHRSDDFAASFADEEEFALRGLDYLRLANTFLKWRRLPDE